MSTVADLLESKGRMVFSIDAEASVFEAIEKMVECDVAALVVTDANSELAGIISQRDFATKVVLKDESP
jgi:CBS domain-containing protein